MAQFNRYYRGTGVAILASVFAFITWMNIGCSRSPNEIHQQTETADDETISFLEWDDPFWTGKHRVEFLDQDVEFMVAGEETGISPSQSDRISLIFSIDESVIVEYEELAWDYLHEFVVDDFDIAISKSSDVRAFLYDPTVLIPAESLRESTDLFYLCFSCSWDSEHGLAIVFRDGRPEQVGDQGEFPID